MINGSGTSLTLLGNFLSGKTKSLVSRDACGSQFIPIEPSHYTHKIDGRSDTKMLEMRLVETNRARTAQAKSANSLGHGGFDAGSEGILLDSRLWWFDVVVPLARLRTALVVAPEVCGEEFSMQNAYTASDWGRLGNTRVENLILMTSFFRLSMVGVQLMLVFPSGQTACLACQSIVK